MTNDFLPIRFNGWPQTEPRRDARSRRGRAMTKVKRVNTSNDAGALAMSPNVRAMRCDARRERRARRDGTGGRGDGSTRRDESACD